MKKHQYSFKWKNHIKENLSNEMAQAVIKLTETEHVSLKIFWTICLGLANSLCFYLVIASFLSYFDYEVSTTKRIFYETPTPFPKVTICNYNPFTTRFTVDYLRSFFPVYDIFDDTTKSNLTAEEKKHLIVEAYQLATSKLMSKEFGDENRKKLGHNLEDILFHCSFNNKQCNYEDFEWTFSNFYGNCYVFNGGNNTRSIKSSFLAGSLFGLNLQLYANFDQKLSEFNTPFGPAIYIRIENGTSLKGETFDGIMIPTGFITYVSLDRVFNHNLKRPYSNCEISDTDSANDFQSDLYKLISHSSYDYTQELCFFQCIQKNLIKQCNCTHPMYVSLFENVGYCDTKEKYDCRRKVFDEKQLSIFIRDVCKPQCPLECNQTSFKVTQSSARLSGDTYAKYINENKNLSLDFDNKPVSAEQAEKSFVHARIFYESLSYTLSTESPKIDVISLLANIGGTLGLFLGVSALSACELIEVLIQFLFYVKK